MDQQETKDYQNLQQKIMAKKKTGGAVNEAGNYTKQKTLPKQLQQKRAVMLVKLKIQKVMAKRRVN